MKYQSITRDYELSISGYCKSVCLFLEKLCLYCFWHIGYIHLFITTQAWNFFLWMWGAPPPDPRSGLRTQTPLLYTYHMTIYSYGTNGSKNFEKNYFLKNAFIDLNHRYFDDSHHLLKKISTEPWGYYRVKSKSHTYTIRKKCLIYDLANLNSKLVTS